MFPTFHPFAGSLALIAVALILALLLFYDPRALAELRHRIGRLPPVLRGVFFLVAALALIAPTTACTTLEQATQSFTSATPQQANTLGDAELMSTFVDHRADDVVNSGILSVDALNKLDTIRKTLYSNLTDLRSANTKGQSLNFTAFNDAFNDFLAWETSNGVK